MVRGLSVRRLLYEYSGVWPAEGIGRSTHQPGLRPSLTRSQNKAQGETNCAQLDPDDRLVSDLRPVVENREVHQAQAQQLALTTSEQILNVRAGQNDERRKEADRAPRNAIRKALLIVQLTDVESKSTDAVTRVSDGFQDLIRRTYPEPKVAQGHHLHRIRHRRAMRQIPPQRDSTAPNTPAVTRHPMTSSTSSVGSRPSALASRSKLLLKLRIQALHGGSRPRLWCRSPASTVCRSFHHDRLNNVVRSEAAALLPEQRQIPASRSPFEAGATTSRSRRSPVPKGVLG